MRILFVHNDYGRYSGEEQAIEDIAKVLSVNGHEIGWFRHPSPNKSYSVSKKIRGFFSGIYSFKSKRWIDRILKERNFDLVQIQNLYPFISPSIFSVCKNHNIPIVMRYPNYRLFCPSGLHLSHGELCERCLYGKEWHCILRNCEDHYFTSAGYAIRNAVARTTGMILKNVNRYIVLSEFQKKRFVDGGIDPEKISILPNVILNLKKKNTPARGKYLSFIGRISFEKGIKLLSEAAQRLPDQKFAVAGRVRQTFDYLNGAPPNVEYKGFLTGAALDRLYRETYVLIFPSIWFEGYPNTLVRAMSYGIPVIASRIGAIPEIVDDGVDGFLFEPGNIEDMIQKIREILDDPVRAKKMGEAGAQKVAAQNSESVYYERLMKIYNQAINAR
jgi:glycosyltransferase involved in cell wall biosynthesis